VQMIMWKLPSAVPGAMPNRQTATPMATSANAAKCLGRRWFTLG
jgi:hypothetical protein